MISYVPTFLDQARQFRELHKLDDDHVVTLSVPQWVYDGLGDESIHLLNLHFVNVQGR